MIQNDNERIKKGYFKIIQYLSTINFPILAGLAAVAPICVPLIFGEKWTNSIILIQILAIVGIFKSTGNPIGSLLLAKGRADLGFKWNFALTVTQIIGLYIGAKYGGTIGVAVAFAILLSIYKVLGYPILIKRLIGPCLLDYIKSMWHAFWISAVMFTLVFFIGILLKDMHKEILLILQVLFGIVFFSGLMILTQKLLFVEIKNNIFMIKK